MFRHPSLSVCTFTVAIALVTNVALASPERQAARLAAKADALRESGKDEAALKRLERLLAFPQAHAYQDLALARALQIHVQRVEPLSRSDVSLLLQTPPATPGHAVVGPWTTYTRYDLPVEVTQYLEVAEAFLSHEFGDPSQEAAAELATWATEAEQDVAYLTGSLLARFHHFDKARPFLEAAANGEPLTMASTLAEADLMNAFLIEGNQAEADAWRKRYRASLPVDSPGCDGFVVTPEAKRFKQAESSDIASHAERANAYGAFVSDFPTSEFLPYARYNEAFYTQLAGFDAKPLWEAFLRDFPDHEFSEKVRSQQAKP